MNNTVKNGYALIGIAFLAMAFVMNPNVFADKYNSIKSLKETKKTSYVIVLGGDHCPWCTKQKQELSKQTEIDWTYVDAKTRPDLMNPKSRAIPQLVIYTKKKDGTWVHKTHVGYKNVSSIRKLIEWQQKQN